MSRATARWMELHAFHNPYQCSQSVESGPRGRHVTFSRLFWRRLLDQNRAAAYGTAAAWYNLSERFEVCSVDVDTK